MCGDSFSPPALENLLIRQQRIVDLAHSYPARDKNWLTHDDKLAQAKQGLAINIFIFFIGHSSIGCLIHCAKAGSGRDLPRSTIVEATIIYWRAPATCNVCDSAKAQKRKPAS